MHLAVSNHNDDKFYVDFDRSRGHEKLSLARAHAASAQTTGQINRSVRIYRNGELVDLKRL